ncbi:hypothetical protein [Rhizorhabdus sp.]|jgi:hypothetical protein|uniref:hypothetical protein n=1 Tax=Rhizorhabdus sp. TaxID=1968843 RepID=UPI00198538B1|nr:hypothetical protein [Rhizorhabdus sp.]MBD3762296.1 hypothetical protein [Rhizorhabdus sp.]
MVIIASYGERVAPGSHICKKSCLAGEDGANLTQPLPDHFKILLHSARQIFAQRSG